MKTRDVTAEAGLSIAMVNCHYGNQTTMLARVLERRLGELNQSRVRRLYELAYMDVVRRVNPTLTNYSGHLFLWSRSPITAPCEQKEGNYANPESKGSPAGV